MVIEDDEGRGGKFLRMDNRQWLFSKCESKWRASNMMQVEINRHRKSNHLRETTGKPIAVPWHMDYCVPPALHEMDMTLNFRAHIVHTLMKWGP